MYFLTRAQAFKPPLLGAFLRSLNMLPVYRVRDGFGKITKNEDTFQQCISYLERTDAILVFPEANHNLKRRIRPLSKGFTRIVFGAMEKSDWEMDLHIVPVGVNYSCHQKSRSYVSVHFGEAILAKDYQEQWLADEREATEDLKEEVSGQMKELTTHIPDLKEYPLHELLLDRLETNRKLLTKPAVMNKRVEQVSQIATESLVEKATALTKQLEKNNVELGQPLHEKASSFPNPLRLLFRLNTFIPTLPAKHMVHKVLKDHAFDASIKFVIALLLFPFFFLLVGGLIYLTSGSAMWSLGYLAVSFLSVMVFPGWLNLSSSTDVELTEDIRQQLLEFRKLRHSLFDSE